MLNELKDKRILTENMPFKGRFSGRFFGSFGKTPQEIAQITESAAISFCLDFGHAWSVAFGLKKDPVAVVKEFLAMEPSMFHFYDSVMKSEVDEHLNLGDGDADLGLFKLLLPKDGIITLETAPIYEKRRNDIRIMREGL